MRIKQLKIIFLVSSDIIVNRQTQIDYVTDDHQSELYENFERS